jgi:hypothetical protein
MGGGGSRAWRRLEHLFMMSSAVQSSSSSHALTGSGGKASSPHGNLLRVVHTRDCAG